MVYCLLSEHGGLNFTIIKLKTRIYRFTVILFTNKAQELDRTKSLITVKRENANEKSTY